MAKYLDSSGITTLVGTLTGKYNERYASLTHKHSSSDVNTLTGYSSTSVSGTTLSDSDTLNAALKKLFNLANSKLSSISIATRTVLGGIKTGKHYTAAATFSPVSSDPTTAPSINSISTTANRYYAVETDSNGLAFVNVPWTDANTTYSIATTSTAGLVKPFSVITKPTINNLSSTSGRYYHVEMSSDGNMFVNVPWTDTKNAGTVTSVAMTVPTGFAISGSPITGAGTLALTFSSGYSLPTTAKQTNWDTAYSWGDHASAGYTKNTGTVTSVTLTQGTGITVSDSGTAITSSGTRTISLKQATSTELGGIKIGYGASGKNYAVQLDEDGAAFVNVPWTDTNTTYAAAKFNTLGLLKPSKTYTGAATLTTTAASATTAPTIAAISATNGRYYAVESDVNGVPFVNVPWTDTNTTYTFTPSNPTLAWGAPSTIGTIGGQTFTVTMPAKPTASDVGALASNGTAVQANKVTNALTIKINSGTTEGTNLYTFDGSAAKTLDIKAGSNVSLNAAAGVLTINATNTNYYPTTFTWTAGTTAGPTGSLTGSGMGAVSFAAIPTASGSASGVVTTGAQTFAGTKTLTATLQIGSTAVSPAGSNDSTLIATTAFVHDAITNDITALSESEIQSAVEAALSAI